MARCTARSCGKNFQALNALCMGNYRPSATYSEDAIAYFAALATQPEASVKTAYNNFFVNHSTEIGLHDQLFLNLAEYEDNKMTPLVNYDSFSQTKISSPVFEKFGGAKGFTSSAYDSGFIPSTHATHYTSNDACFWVYNATPTLVGNYLRLAGCSKAGEAGAMGMYFLNNPVVGGGINTYNVISKAITLNPNQHYGLWSFVKSGTTINVYRNGVFFGTQTRASDGVPNVSYYELADNLGGTLSNAYNGGKIFASGFGKGTIDQANLYEGIKNYIGDLPLWKFYGDSIFAGYGFSNPLTESIPYQLCQLDGTHYMYNRSISGTTVLNFYNSGEAVERTNNADGIVFADWIVNDAVQAIGTSVYGAKYRDFIDRAIAAGAAKVVMILPYITDSAVTSVWGGYVTEAQTIAGEYSEVQLIDLRSSPYTLSDGTHPTTAGAEEAAALIFAQL